MSDRQQLNEMKQFMKIAEGAWQLPRSKEDFDKLALLLAGHTNNVTVHNNLYNILGDDELFDRLDKLDPQGYNASDVIIQWMKDQRTNEFSNFPNIWNTFQLSQRDDSPMNEGDPDDTDWDAHWAREDGDEERADDLEVDAEFARMDDELSEDENDARGKMCPVCTGGRREGYGHDCPNCGGEGYLEEERDRVGEWTSRSFNAIGPPNGPWHVEDRLAIRDNIVAGPFDDKDEAWAVADEMQTEKGKKEAEWYKRGNKGMWGGDVHMNSNLDEVGEVKHDDMGATPVYEDDPEVWDGKSVEEGFGHIPQGGGVDPHKFKYDVVLKSVGYGSDAVKNVPFAHALKAAEKQLRMFHDISIGGGGDEEDMHIEKTYYRPTIDGQTVELPEWMIKDKITGEIHYLTIQPTKQENEGISLDDIVENVLQEYPGQPKDYDDPDYDEDDLGPAAQGKSNAMIDMGAEDVPMSDYENDFIDPEYEDSELGFRFD